MRVRARLLVPGAENEALQPKADVLASLLDPSRRQHRCAAPASGARPTDPSHDPVPLLDLLSTSRWRSRPAQLVQDRSSARILPDMTVTLPLEVQVEILAIANARFLASNWQEVRNDPIPTCALVSTLWNTECQKLMLAKPRITVLQDGRKSPSPLLKLCWTLQAAPRLGAYIKTLGHLIRDITLAPALVLLLRHMPHLTVLALRWTQAVARLPAPPLDLPRPTLTDLRLVTFLGDWAEPVDASRITPISAWLNLTRLNEVEYIGDAIYFINTLGAQLPTPNSTFRSWGIDILELGDLLEALQSRHPDLRDLAIIPRMAELVDRQSPVANPLAYLGALRRLTFIHDVPEAILDVGHPLLKNLILGQRKDETWRGDSTNRIVPGDWRRSWPGFVPSHPLRRAVEGLCRRLAETPNPYPALRSLGISADEPLNVPLVCFASQPRWLPPGLLGMARKVRSAGLVFTDRKGKVWRDEWFDVFAAQEAREAAAEVEAAGVAGQSASLSSVDSDISGDDGSSEQGSESEPEVQVAGAGAGSIIGGGDAAPVVSASDDEEGADEGWQSDDPSSVDSDIGGDDGASDFSAGSDENSDAVGE